MKFCNFYPQLSLGTVFSALKLTQIRSINMKISLIKTGNLITNWLPLFYSYMKLERVSSQSDKI